jgi:tetratricopeptide (TPR) repeat protein
MSKTSHQLETVSQEVTEYFADIPHITVTPGEGSPPDQYTVNYKITGVCKENDGDVHSCTDHTISISLPFGFPHFPPNCLPESPTFHPDFDSSAICIGDVWEADKSIVTLILHIARMISGEIYSENNAFNEDAAEWYRDNQDQIPFDRFEVEEQELPASLPAEEDDNDPGSIDTLGDDDFGGPFTLEEDSVTAAGIDIDRLRVIAKQKRFQTLSRELQAIEEPFDGREELEEQAQTAMDEAMALFLEAEAMEHQGTPKDALEKYHAVANLVSDYPMLQEAKNRVQQAFDLLGDWVNSEPDDQKNDILTGESEASDTASSKSANRTFFEETKKGSKKLFLVALGGGSVALIATLLVTYLSLGSSLEKADKRFTECQTLLNANNFQEAEKKCDEALGLTAEVRMVKQDEKDELARKIQALLDSPKLRQGLVGKTLLDGKYVTKSNIQLILAFKEAKKNGDSFFEKELWDEAVVSYAKALDISKHTNTIDTISLAEIRQKLPHAQFNNMVQAGKKSLTISDWSAATEYFDKALQLAKTNPRVVPEDFAQVKLLSNQAKFHTMQEQGHKSFSAGKWDAALSSYEGALDLVGKIGPSAPDTRSSLQENIAKTKIYLTIEKGKKAFAASQWDDVIAQYAKAILLLEENSKLLSRINTKESRVKLSRIMLHASIIQDKQDVAKYLKSEEYTSVLKTLGSIKQSITSSQFAEQEEFQTILTEIESQKKDTEKQLVLIKQTTYLTDNFEKLFLKHYPSSTLSVLSAPKVEYLKNIGNKLLFRMQCTETAGGRPLRLQMDYLYSPSSKSWSFYTEE